MNEPSGLADPHAELLELTRALGAQLEVLNEGGCDALGTTLPSLAPSVAAPPTTGGAARTNTAPKGAAPAPGQRSAPAQGPAPVAAPKAMPSAPAATAHASALESEPVVQRLQVLQEAVRQCTRCGLHQGRTQTVFARGTGSVGLCFVGEGPGADEDAQGFPFVGKAGQLLDKMITAMGMTRDEVYVCNIVKCRPPNNRKPEPEEMSACVPYLHEQLELINPQVIVALGATAVQGLLGSSEGITRMRGKWKLYRGKVPVMPTFHPAYLLRQPEAKREVWADLQAVLQSMGRSIPARS
ncbi:MAG TPA: uracil-DNA glycosylase family protein [Polyangiaceae bacterium]|nr:uracil-DNA glycosylase family protein [Polyangiaceae bacterium]